MQERLIEIDALSEIAKQVGYRKSTSLVEELAGRPSAGHIGDSGLFAGEPTE